MLSDQCTEVARLAAKLTETRELRGQARGIKNRWQQITNLQQRLGDLAVVSSQLKKHRISVTEKEGASEALRTNVAEVRELARRAPLEFVDSPRVTDLVTDRLPEYLLRLERALKKAWAQHISTHATAANQEFLAVLNKINAFSATVKKIQDLNERLSRRKESLPKATDDFEEVDQIIQALETAWQRIGGEKVPAAVREFLSEAVSSRGAALPSFTDEVADWLADHKINDQFVIRNRSL